MQQKNPIPGIFVILLDVIAICILLVVFALFHHGLPREDSGINQQLVFGSISPIAAIPSATPEQIETSMLDSTLSPSTEPSPTPVPQPGDFSATFPDYDTSAGIDALFSYQDDDKRIVVYNGKVDDATYYVADVWIRNILFYKTAFAKGTFARYVADTTVNIAQENGAIVAISGDYYGARNSGFVVRNGVLYRDSVSSDVCVLYADGTMESYYQNQFDVEAAIDRGAYQSWCFGPKLLDNGKIPDSYRLNDISNRHPRAAIGYFEPGHYCLVVIDGRQGDYSRGMTFEQMSRLFISLGCVDAYNLDGGQTAVMVFQGEIVNRPYNNGRPVSDIIYF